MHREFATTSTYYNDTVIKIYTVCLGNICRSPIAQAVLQKSLADAGLDDLTIVESAGTAGYHQGEDADSRTISLLAQRGYELNHRAQKLTPTMLEEAELILVMDQNNYDDVIHLSRQIEKSTGVDHSEKVRLMLSFDENADELEVPDPWYGSMADFEHVLQLVEASSPGVVKYIQDELLA